MYIIRYMYTRVSFSLLLLRQRKWRHYARMRCSPRVHFNIYIHILCIWGTLYIYMYNSHARARALPQVTIIIILLYYFTEKWAADGDWWDEHGACSVVLVVTILDAGYGVWVALKVIWRIAFNWYERRFWVRFSLSVPLWI